MNRQPKKNGKRRKNLQPDPSQSFFGVLSFFSANLTEQISRRKDKDADFKPLAMLSLENQHGGYFIACRTVGGAPFHEKVVKLNIEIYFANFISGAGLGLDGQWPWIIEERDLASIRTLFAALSLAAVQN